MFMFRFTQKKWKTKIKVMLLDDKKFTIYGHEERRKDKWWGRMHMANVKSWDDFFSSIRQHNPHFFVRCLVFRYLFEKNCTERKDLSLTSHVFEFIFWMCLLSLSLSLFLFCFMNLHGYLRWIYSSESLLCIWRYK